MSDNVKTVNGKEEQQLERNLSLFEAIMYGVSFVIGTGVFLKPSAVLSSTGSTGMALIVWVLAGFISLCSALTIAEIAAYIPKVGGLYTYISELFGEAIGFIYGWVSILVSGPGGAAASAIAFATFASYFIPLNLWTMRIVSIALVVFFAIIQYFSTKGAMRLQVIGTVGKLAPIFAVLLVGLFRGSIPGSVNMDLIGTGENLSINVALIGALWAYDGWVATCNLGDEMINSERNLPIAIVASLIFVTLVYAAFNFVIFRNVPPAEVAVAENAGVLAAEVLFGPAGATLITAGVLVSSAITMNAQMMNNERTIFSMAQRELIPFSNQLSSVHPKNATPVYAIVAQVLLTIIFIMSGTFETVTNMVIFVVWVFFTLAMFGIFKLRKDYPRRADLYSVPLYPIIPLIGIVGGGYLVVTTLISLFRLSMIGVVVGIIGLPVFMYYQKKRDNR